MQVALILGLSRIIGLLFQRMNQPQVVGEMLAGIMLGPSLFGWLAPHASAAIFPAASVAYLNVLSQVGVIFFLFLVGLELDPRLIRNRGHAAVVISHVSIVAPFFARHGTHTGAVSKIVQSVAAHAVSIGRPFHGRFDEHHRFPGAGPHSHRTQSAQNQGRSRHHHLRGCG